MQSPGPTDSPAWACRRPGRLLRPPAPAIARPTLPHTPPHRSADCADGAGVGHRDSKQCRAGPGGSQARHGPADGHRSRPGASGHHRWHRAQQRLLPQPPLCLLLPARNRQARVAWRNGHAGLVLVASEHIFAPSRTTSTRQLCLFAAGNHQHSQQHLLVPPPHPTPPRPRARNRAVRAR